MDHPNQEQSLNEPISAEQYMRSPSATELREEQIKLKREQRRQAKLRSSLLIDKITSGIYFLIGILEVLLGFRFLLQLAQANHDNIFARLIFGLSEPFAAPFFNLFNHGEVTNFDASLLVAMVVYWLLGIMITWFIGLMRN